MNEPFKGKKSIYLRLYHLLRRVQQVNRFVTRDLGTDLNITESFLLLELDAGAASTAQELAQLVRIDKSVVSRNINSLVSLGYVQTTQSRSDRRSNALRITTSGKKFLKQYDAISNAAQLAPLDLLTPAEQERITRAFRHFADTLEAGPYRLREDDHPFRVEEHRITRVLGFLNKFFMGSFLNVAQWQVLSEVELNDGKQSFVELAEKLTSTPSSISTIITILEKKGCIVRETKGSGRRSNVISVTDQGARTLRGIENEYCALIEQGFRGLSLAELEDCASILSKALGISGVVALTGEFEIRRLDGEETRGMARAFLVENLILFRKHIHLPAQILADDSISYALYDGRTIRAVAETRPNGEGLVLINYVAAPSGVTREQQKSFLDKTLELARRETGIEKVSIPPTSLANELLH